MCNYVHIIICWTVNIILTLEEVGSLYSFDSASSVALVSGLS